jgi:hypothetical protein
MELISKPIKHITLTVLLFIGCQKDSILILADQHCIVRKSNKKIYQLCLEVRKLQNDSLILADCFINKGKGNKFCLRSWMSDYQSSWSQSKDELIFKNCKYIVQTSFRDDRTHPPLVFTTDSIGNILLENN